ncbi:outer membrane efflux protein [Lucifera butyrica]|uniref:Outer membrane efflux protein n=1 Tax=Lucifera butyrica TaxID=1351585 RepID=A0A498RA31_9FIRM|nr:TolC family protein [Lucifera butyrica]VBB07800.1 outer membrane efflux protein [Lucifera butyrica]
MNRFFLLVLGIFLFAVQPVLAAAPGLSVTGAIQEALNNNDEIKAASESLAAGKEEIGVANSRLLPKVTLEERALRTNNPGYVFSTKMDQGRFTLQDLQGAPDTFNQPGLINDFQTTVSIMQPVVAKEADIGITMARQEYAAQQADFIRKREEVAFAVVQAYLSLHTAAEYKTAAETALVDAREHLRIADSRYKAGLGLYSDMLRASTAVTGAEEKLVSVQKNLTVAKRQLGLLLGKAEPVEIDGSFPSLPLRDIGYYTNTAKARADVKALELRCENSQNNVNLKAAGNLPTFSVGAGYQMNDPDKPFGSAGDNWQVMAVLQWNVFDGTRTEHESRKARRQLEESRIYLDGLKKKVAFQVYEAFAGVEEAAKNVELAQAALASAAEGKRLVEARYQNSLSPIVDVLDAQLNLDNARAGVVEKENNYRQALTKLSYSSGTLLTDFAIK